MAASRNKIVSVIGSDGKLKPPVYRQLVRLSPFYRNVAPQHYLPVRGWLSESRREPPWDPYGVPGSLLPEPHYFFGDVLN